MDDESLERRLREVPLSAPGVTFAEIEARARQPRAPRPLLRLALATAAVWLVAWVAQVAMDRSLQAVAPMPRVTAVAQDEGVRPPALVERRELLEELVADGWHGPEPVEASGEERHGTRSGRGPETVGRLDHV